MVDEFYTPSEIADRLKLHYRTVHRWLNSGKLKGVKLEKDWRIRREDFEAFIAEHEAKTAQMTGVE